MTSNQIIRSPSTEPRDPPVGSTTVDPGPASTAEFKPSTLAQTLPRLSEGAPTRRTPRFKFKIPLALQGGTAPKEIVLRELTADQQIDAGRLGGGDRTKAGHELGKMSLYAVDGVIVDHGNFDADVYFGKWPAKIRQLVMEGYAKIHNTTPDEDASFLESIEPV